MSQTILFIDGENFLHKVKDILKNKNIKKSQYDITQMDFSRIFDEPLADFNITKKIFYAAKLRSHPETKDLSDKLIKTQRKLRNTLLKHQFEFEISGNVRGQKVGNKIIFKEKGVDVKIAVDLVSLACDKKIKTAILCSSDSDLQPAIKELRKRNIEVVYLGFERNPNKGLSYTSSRTILFRDSEIIKSCSIK